MMKRKCSLVFFLFVFAIMLTGCSNQLGKTRDEVRREHARTIRINRQEIMEDLDRALLLDKPSLMTDKRIP
jgi:hypothetical protein